MAFYNKLGDNPSPAGAPTPTPQPPRGDWNVICVGLRLLLALLLTWHRQRTGDGEGGKDYSSGLSNYAGFVSIKNRRRILNKKVF